MLLILMCMLLPTCLKVTFCKLCFFSDFPFQQAFCATKKPQLMLGIWDLIKKQSNKWKRTIKKELVTVKRFLNNSNFSVLQRHLFCTCCIGDGCIIKHYDQYILGTRCMKVNHFPSVSLISITSGDWPSAFLPGVPMPFELAAIKL